MEKINQKSIDFRAAEKGVEEIKKFKGYIQKVWKNSKPLAKLFKTSSDGYLYDTGTNKILRCDKLIFDLIEKLFSMEIDKAVREYLKMHDLEKFLYSAERIKNAIETENILLKIKAEKFEITDEFQNYEKLINSSMEIVFLEVTDSCPLRCKYCVYNNHVTYKRNHGKNNMSSDVAYRAIDYLKNHSYKSKQISISFYGGEPLFEFNLIKSCVEYARSILKEKEPIFSITTNGILYTPEIAEFLYKNDFKVLVSLDGPEEIHNSYRVDINGIGSFEKTLQGLRYLVDVYGDSSNKKIHLSMVYTPPFSGKRLDRVAQLWEEIPWLPKDLNINITYPARGSILMEYFSKELTSEDKNLQKWSYEKFLDKYIGKSNSNPIANSIIERGLAELIQRPVYQEPIDIYSLNGCCIPGVRRLYVDTYGNFHLCERIDSDAPTIGDVYSGINLEVIEKIYINGYKEVIIPNCSVCWAVGLCNACYTDIFNEGKLDFEVRRTNCISKKKSLERFFTYYCSLKELNPKGIQYLYKYELT